ncbi:hypothetical protein DENSPDRAFT_780906 [Dentipellis sp. KUC8613]|nr:hypothetical protein DENSPDRAFT_780906 [Dentipellis sp. KUC8613]
MDSPTPNGTPSKLARPFLHPTVSRLRSFTPRTSVVTSAMSPSSNLHGGDSPAPSHFSALSPMSSSSNLRALSEKRDIPINGHDSTRREVFRWTPLRNIGHYINPRVPHKASALLGSVASGSPMVLAANGLICIGTDIGKVFVFDFKQTLMCVCGDAASEKTVGPVTALALSHDHTFVAVGHAFGHVQLFDLSKPQAPARFVPPTSLAAVASGRKEGHLLGSRIVNVGFIAGRHTAIVSADENGLAFYHSLGKVLFVDASDVLRILGKYPEEEPPIPHQIVLPKTSGAPPPPPALSRRRKSRKANTILAMSPLPLGTSPHPTDSYNVIALLTAAKLVIVGLRPSPKTWYRRHRGEDDEQMGKSKYRAAMAWFPSVVVGASGTAEPMKKGAKSPPPDATVPMLVYSWGNVLTLLRVSESKTIEKAVNQRNGKTTDVEVGHLTFEEGPKWSAQDDVLAIQWLNANQIVVATASSLEVYDVRTLQLVEHVPFDASTLVSPTLASTLNGAVSYADSRNDIAHSVRTYKGKIFLLGRQDVQVGTLLTWADRILSFVQDGDFLSAIDLTRSYYLGTAPGNKNTLPEDPDQLKSVVGEKMRELMLASMRYAFSEDRMTDATHYTPDGRGVDRTSLFENLIVTCARACIALDDFEFLYEDLFQAYDDAGIAGIYLEQLETFVVDGDIRYVPPRITQRLVAMHAEDNRPQRAEKIIWHIDPECLDINQAISLCQKYHLYDALIYVYTRALKDYVSPIVELLGLIRKFMQYRRDRPFKLDAEDQDKAIEATVLNAYKIFPYLGDVLCGLTYPSEDPLEADEAFQAKRDIYTFLFFGRSSVWPLGEGGKLVLTSEEEGGVEPTYPYCRLLLRFDSESFLHSLDMAFEDSYLNDESQGTSRLIIVKILLEVLSTPGLSNADITFVNIFIARNVPKYPQFIQIAPSALHNILIGLARDPDHSTREDRQLAAEYLLSVYTPHESERILHIFEEAQFYRILRSWHRQEQQWAPLLLAYLHDPELQAAEVFRNADEILQQASRRNKGVVPDELVETLSEALPEFLSANVMDAASFIDKHAPQLHEKAIETLGADADHKQFAYLHHLLGPSATDDEDDSMPAPKRLAPSEHVPRPLRQLYIFLQCRMDPSGVIPALKYLPPDFLDWDEALQTCETREVFDAVVWALDWRGNPTAALAKLEAFDKKLTAQIGHALTSQIESEPEPASLQESITALQAIIRVGVSVCLRHSKAISDKVPVEDLWFQLLHTQIDSVQSVLGCCSSQALSFISEDASETENMQIERRTLTTLRALIQETFLSLVSASSSRGVSFPRLFKRLVDASSHSAKGTPYTEFRTILTSMMESYRSEGDMLIITKHLLERDIFETVELSVRERAKGWSPSGGVCAYCRKVLLPNKQPSTPSEEVTGDVVVDKIVVSRTGSIYHSRCLPSDSLSNTVH